MGQVESFLKIDPGLIVLQQRAHNERHKDSRHIYQERIYGDEGIIGRGYFKD
jgi:hypothetical protein